MPGKLYVVGTPIGNLSDFSPRAVETLEKVDFIAAEDTRVTVKLLNHFEINKPMLAYYEHNKMQRGGDIIARLLGGEDCALVSDAGMPAISDPGEDLVRLCHENGIPVESVPGPSALITALAISGMKSGRFCFEGFLSVNKPSRRAHLAELKTEPRTMIFYEAPHKLPATLKDMLEAFGDRKIALCREITKLNEEMGQNIAKAGNGAYIRVDNTNNAQRLLEKEVDKLAKADVTTEVYKDYDEQFQLVAWIVLLLLVLDILILPGKSRFTRNFNLFGENR
jgi:16S rRNA (cytidine1402-2'-O)-methyltransferase